MLGPETVTDGEFDMEVEGDALLNGPVEGVAIVSTLADGAGEEGSKCG